MSSVKKGAIVFVQLCSLSSINAHCQFLTKNHDSLVNYTLHLPDLASYDFPLFGELPSPLKRSYYAVIPGFQKVCTDILRALPVTDLESSLDTLLGHANQAI